MCRLIPLWIFHTGIFHILEFSIPGFFIFGIFKTINFNHPALAFLHWSASIINFGLQANHLGWGPFNLSYPNITSEKSRDTVCLKPFRRKTPFSISRIWKISIFYTNNLFHFTVYPLLSTAHSHSGHLLLYFLVTFSKFLYALSVFGLDLK